MTYYIPTATGYYIEGALSNNPIHACDFFTTHGISSGVYSQFTPISRELEIDINQFKDAVTSHSVIKVSMGCYQYSEVMTHVPTNSLFLVVPQTGFVAYYRIHANP